MNLTHVFEQADIVLIAVFLLLIFMSMLSWAVIIWKFLQSISERNYLKEYKIKGTSNTGIAALTEVSSRLEIELKDTNQDVREKVISLNLAQTLDKIKVGLDNGLTILASVGSSAPFIGLFGTVWGIYVALMKIAEEGNASLNVVAGPMGEALVATAIGLFAAIPAVLAYNAFVRSNRVIMLEYRHIAEQLSVKNLTESK